MNLTFKPFTKDYLDKVMEIEVLSFFPPWSRDTFKYTISDERSHFIVALDDADNVIAYGGISMVLDEANLDSIAVHPDYRGYGIGKSLLEELIKYCKSNEVLILMLEVRLSNTNAISLYKSFGFIEVGTRRNYYTHPDEDALLMNLDI